MIYMAEFILEVGNGDNTPSGYFEHIWNYTSGLVCVG